MSLNRIIPPALPALRLHRFSQERQTLTARLAELDASTALTTGAAGAPLHAARTRAQQSLAVRAQLQREVQKYCGGISAVTARRVLRRLRARAALALETERRRKAETEAATRAQAATAARAKSAAAISASSVSASATVPLSSAAQVAAPAAAAPGGSHRVSPAVEDWFLLQVAELGVAPDDEQDRLASDESDDDGDDDDGDDGDSNGGNGDALTTAALGGRGPIGAISGFAAAARHKQQALRKSTKGSSSKSAPSRSPSASPPSGSASASAQPEAPKPAVAKASKSSSFGFSFFNMFFGGGDDSDTDKAPEKPTRLEALPPKPAPAPTSVRAPSPAPMTIDELSKVYLPEAAASASGAESDSAHELIAECLAPVECVLGGPAARGTLALTARTLRFIAASASSSSSSSSSSGSAASSTDGLSVGIEHVRAMSLVQPQLGIDAGASLTHAGGGSSGSGSGDDRDEVIILQITLEQARDAWAANIRFLGSRSKLMPMHHAFLIWIMSFEASPAPAAASTTVTDPAHADLSASASLAADDATAAAAAAITSAVASAESLHRQSVLEIDLAGESDILGAYELREVVAAAPPRYRLNRWRLLYSMTRMGVSLKTMYRSIEDARGTIVLLRDQGGKVFGAYASECWKPRAGYYGSGEGFVFEFAPAFRRYAWTGDNSFFMMSSAEALAVGGGSNFAFFVDKEILNGTSGACTTFNSPRLSSTDQFQVGLFEVWGNDL